VVVQWKKGEKSGLFFLFFEISNLMTLIISPVYYKYVTIHRWFFYFIFFIYSQKDDFLFFAAEIINYCHEYTPHQAIIHDLPTLFSI
jgi:hypothetical protein